MASSIRLANASFSPNYTPVAVFVGGTSGIGQGMAEAFGKWTKGNAHIVIVGRNKAAAEAIIKNIPKPTSESSTATWSHEFVQCDATLMKNVDSAAREIISKHPKINFLIMSPGYMTSSGRDETEEGIDKKLAVHYYARWKFIDRLLPSLRRANEGGEDSKVFSVLAAGKGGEIDLNDLGLKKSFSLTNAALAAPTYNDLMMESFSERNPNLTFTHAYPGIVRTNLLASSSSPLLKSLSGVINGLIYPFSTSQADCAEYMWSAVFNHTKGAFRTGSKGENLLRKRYFGSEEQRARLWEHSEEATRTTSSPN